MKTNITRVEIYGYETEKYGFFTYYRSGRCRTDILTTLPQTVKDFILANQDNCFKVFDPFNKENVLVIR